MSDDKNYDPYWLTPKDHAKKTHGWRRLSLQERQRREMIKDFMGDFAANEIMQKVAPAISAHDLFASVFEQIKRDNNTPLQKLQDNWEKFVGVDLAKLTFPVSMYAHRLQIQVNNSSLLYVLNNEYKDNILRNLKHFKELIICDIRFVAAGRLDTKANYKKK